ncbi:hypothetical protein BDV24DRAFT_122693 [Aspergillus arachidicola]|uniref:Uncharacterized protein n=1 Tax=Aspergillus arachidicola TaxID=656916 RepID=A0A5N6YRL2_9EURO|nr:hypothetical protein BDV24DRAFT_122693 [Aspergillus arachidicola]
MRRLLLSRLEKQGGDQIIFEDVLKGAAANTAVTKDGRIPITSEIPLWGCLSARNAIESKPQKTP